MKILHLTLKKKWFDMISSGEKREEYREIKWYWVRRLTTCGRFPPCVRSDFARDLAYPPVNIYETLKIANTNFAKYDFIIFRNGYHKGAREVTVKCEGILIGPGKPEWGGKGSEEWTFVIKLGKIINH